MFMLRFISHWLTDAFRLLCMLGGALLAMQVPALTYTYATALLQVAQDARRDIDQREANARLYYHLPDGAGDQAVIEALRRTEPSNATSLEQSISRMATFSDTYARIVRATPLLQPLVAAWDAVAAPQADKLAVLRTSIETYAPQVMLQTTAAMYGIAGLLLGGLIGHSLLALAYAGAYR
jgi:DUF2937 family protein